MTNLIIQNRQLASLERLLLEQYGSEDLPEKLETACGDLWETNYLQTIWNRSHSDWSWQNLTCSFGSDWKNIRQVAAELNRKRQALDEARWNLLELQSEVVELRKQPQSVTRDIQIGKRESRIHSILEKFEGALKDIAALKKIHDDLQEKLGDITEADFERYERESHVNRAIRQSIRDMRMTGVISTGNQEYLEQCGVNPATVQKRIVYFLEAQDDSFSTDPLKQFVSDLIEDITG